MDLNKEETNAGGENNEDDKTTSFGKAKGSGSDSKLADAAPSNSDVSSTRESHSEHTISSSNSEKQDKESVEKDTQKQREKEKDGSKRKRERGAEENGTKDCLKNAVGDVRETVCRVEHVNSGSYMPEIMGSDTTKSTCRLQCQIADSSSGSHNAPQLSGNSRQIQDSARENGSTSDSSKPSKRSGKRKGKRRKKRPESHNNSTNEVGSQNKVHEAETDTTDAGDSNCIDSSLSVSHSDLHNSSEISAAIDDKGRTKALNKQRGGVQITIVSGPREQSDKVDGNCFNHNRDEKDKIEEVQKERTWKTISIHDIPVSHSELTTENGQESEIYTTAPENISLSEVENVSIKGAMTRKLDSCHDDNKEGFIEFASASSNDVEVLVPAEVISAISTNEDRQQFHSEVNKEYSSQLDELRKFEETFLENDDSSHNGPNNASRIAAEEMVSDGQEHFTRDSGNATDDYMRGILNVAANGDNIDSEEITEQGISDSGVSHDCFDYMAFQDPGLVLIEQGDYLLVDRIDKQVKKDAVVSETCDEFPTNNVSTEANDVEESMNKILPNQHEMDIINDGCAEVTIKSVQRDQSLPEFDDDVENKTNDRIVQHSGGDELLQNTGMSPSVIASQEEVEVELCGQITVGNGRINVDELEDNGSEPNLTIEGVAQNDDNELNKIADFQTEYTKQETTKQYDGYNDNVMQNEESNIDGEKTENRDIVYQNNIPENLLIDLSTDTCSAGDDFSKKVFVSDCDYERDQQDCSDESDHVLENNQLLETTYPLGDDELLKDPSESLGHNPDSFDVLNAGIHQVADVSQENHSVLDKIQLDEQIENEEYRPEIEEDEETAGETEETVIENKLYENESNKEQCLVESPNDCDENAVDDEIRVIKYDTSFVTTKEENLTDDDNIINSYEKTYVAADVKELEVQLPSNNATGVPMEDQTTQFIKEENEECVNDPSDLIQETKCVEYTTKSIQNDKEKHVVENNFEEKEDTYGTLHHTGVIMGGIFKKQTKEITFMDVQDGDVNVSFEEETENHVEQQSTVYEEKEDSVYTSDDLIENDVIDSGFENAEQEMEKRNIEIDAQKENNDKEMPVMKDVPDNNEDDSISYVTEKELGDTFEQPQGYGEDSIRVFSVETKSQEDTDISFQKHFDDNGGQEKNEEQIVETEVEDEHQRHTKVPGNHLEEQNDTCTKNDIENDEFIEISKQKEYPEYDNGLKSVVLDMHCDSEQSYEEQKSDASIVVNDNNICEKVKEKPKEETISYATGHMGEGCNMWPCHSCNDKFGTIEEENESEVFCPNEEKDIFVAEEDRLASVDGNSKEIEINQVEIIKQNTIYSDDDVCIEIGKIENTEGDSITQPHKNVSVESSIVENESCVDITGSQEDKEIEHQSQIGDAGGCDLKEDKQMKQLTERDDQTEDNQIEKDSQISDQERSESKEDKEMERITETGDQIEDNQVKQHLQMDATKRGELKEENKIEIGAETMTREEFDQRDEKPKVDCESQECQDQFGSWSGDVEPEWDDAVGGYVCIRTCNPMNDSQSRPCQNITERICDLLLEDKGIDEQGCQMAYDEIKCYDYKENLQETLVSLEDNQQHHIAGDDKLKSMNDDTSIVDIKHNYTIEYNVSNEHDLDEDENLKDSTVVDNTEIPQLQSSVHGEIISEQIEGSRNTVNSCNEEELQYSPGSSSTYRQRHCTEEFNSYRPRAFELDNFMDTLTKEQDGMFSQEDASYEDNNGGPREDLPEVMRGTNDVEDLNIHTGGVIKCAVLECSVNSNTECEFYTKRNEILKNACHRESADDGIEKLTCEDEHIDKEQASALLGSSGCGEFITDVANPVISAYVQNAESMEETNESILSSTKSNHKSGRHIGNVHIIPNVIILNDTPVGDYDIEFTNTIKQEDDFDLKCKLENVALETDAEVKTNEHMQGIQSHEAEDLKTEFEAETSKYVEYNEIGALGCSEIKENLKEFSNLYDTASEEVSGRAETKLYTSDLETNDVDDTAQKYDSFVIDMEEASDCQREVELGVQDVVDFVVDAIACQEKDKNKDQDYDREVAFALLKFDQDLAWVDEQPFFKRDGDEEFSEQSVGLYAKSRNDSQIAESSGFKNSNSGLNSPIYKEDSEEKESVEKETGGEIDEIDYEYRNNEVSDKENAVYELNNDKRPDELEIDDYQIKAESVQGETQRFEFHPPTTKISAPCEQQPVKVKDTPNVAKPRSVFDLDDKALGKVVSSAWENVKLPSSSYKNKPLWRKVVSGLRRPHRKMSKISKKRSNQDGSAKKEEQQKDIKLANTEKETSDDDGWNTLERDVEPMSAMKRAYDSKSHQRGQWRKFQRLRRLRNSAEMVPEKLPAIRRQIGVRSMQRFYSGAHSSSSCASDSSRSTEGQSKGKTRKRRSDLLLHGNIKEVDITGQEAAGSTQNVFEVFCDKDKKEVSDLAGSLANKETPTVRLLMKPLMSGMNAQTAQLNHEKNQSKTTDHETKPKECNQLIDETTQMKARPSKRMSCTVM